MDVVEITTDTPFEQGLGAYLQNVDYFAPYYRDQKVEISDVERERILAEITRSFVSHAASYGFSRAGRPTGGFNAD